MQLAKYSFLLCVAAICLTQGETRRICGLEVEYRGYDPLEALRLVQEQQIQEFTQYQQLLQQLKFKLKSDDYLAWQRCLSEYDRAKLTFTNNAARIKQSFQTQLNSLSARNLAAEQYQQELQNLLQQFQTQFTPSVESFHTNIKNLFDTIQDEKRRKQWWSTVKTTQITTGADGTQTRSSLTQTSSGIGNQQTGYSRQSESNSVSGSLLGGASSMVSKTSSISKTKIGTVVGGGVGVGGYGSQSQYSGNSQKDINEDYNSGSDYSSGGGSGGFQKIESKTRSSIESKTSGFGSGYNNNGNSQESQSKYQSTQESGGYGASQGSKYSLNQESKSSDYGGASKVTKESKYSASSVSSGQTGGSSVDNSQINFSSMQSRTGLREGYGTDSSEAVVKSSGYGSSGGYRRRRRTFGLLAGALGASKRSALGGGSYGSSGYGVNGGGGGVGVGVSVGVGAGVGGGSGVGMGAGSRVGLGGGGGPGGYPQGGFEGGSSNFQAGSSFQSKSGFQGSSGGFQGSSGGFQGSSGGFQGSSGGFQGSSGGFQSSGSQGGSFQGGEYSSRSSLQSSGFKGGSFQGGEYNSGSSLSGDYDSSMQGSKYSKTMKKEKFQETQMSMGSSGVGSSNYGGY